MCKQVDNTTPQTGRERLDTSELEIIELRLCGVTVADRTVTLTL